MSTETQRAEFEAWYLKNLPIKAISRFNDDDPYWGGEYVSADARRSWAIWQAAQSSQAAEIEALRNLLNEVRACFTRDDDLPDDLFPRIDAAVQTKEAS